MKKQIFFFGHKQLQNILMIYIYGGNLYLMILSNYLCHKEFRLKVFPSK